MILHYRESPSKKSNLRGWIQLPYRNMTVSASVMTQTHRPLWVWKRSRMTSFIISRKNWPLISILKTWRASIQHRKIKWTIQRCKDLRFSQRLTLASSKCMRNVWAWMRLWIAWRRSKGSRGIPSSCCGRQSQFFRRKAMTGLFWTSLEPRWTRLLAKWRS